MNSEVTSINIGGGTTNLSITGAGFEPIFALISWSGQSTSNVLSGFLSKQGFGMTNGASQFCSTSHSEDGSAGGDAGGAAYADRLIQALNDSEGDDGRADFVSFNADGMTIDRVTAFPINLLLSILWIGGSDIKSAGAVSFTEGATGFSGINCDLMIFMGMKGTINPTVDSRTMIGFACRGAAGIGNMAWCGGSNNGSVPTQTLSYCRLGDCVAFLDSGMTNVNTRMHIDAWNDGSVSFDFDETSGLTRTFYAILIKGGAWEISSMLTQTDTTTDFTATLAGSTPKVGVLLSGCKALSSSDVPQDNEQISLGYFDSGMEEVKMYMSDRDNQAVSEVNVLSGTGNSYFSSNLAGSIKAFASVKSLQYGSATFRMDDADTEQNGIAVLLGGDAMFPPQPSFVRLTMGLERW